MKGFLGRTYNGLFLVGWFARHIRHQTTKFHDLTLELECGTISQ